MKKPAPLKFSKLLVVKLTPRNSYNDEVDLEINFNRLTTPMVRQLLKWLPKTLSYMDHMDMKDK